MEVAIGTRIFITGGGYDPGLYEWNGSDWFYVGW
jgi:hypothetical protein